MNENDFEGTIVLEKLVEIGKIDAFIEAIDLDDLVRVKSLMKKADLDSNTISIVVAKIESGSD